MSKKIACPVVPGILYFYVHFVVEVVSFYFLNSIVGNEYILWLAPFIYDILAFVPQILFGVISDRFARMSFGLIGMLLLAVGLCMMGMNVASPILLTVIFALGNACVHVNGAEVTLRSGRGKIAPAAIFVAGGLLFAI